MAPSDMAELPGFPCSGEEISNMMRSVGPIVKCVLLRCRPSPDPAGSDAGGGGPGGGGGSAEKSTEAAKKRPPPQASSGSAFERDGAVVKDEAAGEGESSLSSGGGEVSEREKSPGGTELTAVAAAPYEPLTSLIDEIEVDTTPRKSMVAEILGGPFTFLGQYEEEGTVLMIRRPPDEAEEEEDEDGDGDGDCEQGEEKDDVPRVNPHRLQPPFHDVSVRGDILVMKVAKTDDDDGDDDGDDDDSSGSGAEEAEAKEESPVVANADEELTKEQPAASASSKVRADGEEGGVDDSEDSFFLPYTKDEYLMFATRTDVVAPNRMEDSNDSEEEEEEIGPDERVGDGDDEDNDRDDEYRPGNDDDIPSDDDDDDEDSQVGMMNLIFGQILRRFREENGRGPDTRELLEMRSALAERLGVEVPPVDEDECDWDRRADGSESPVAAVAGGGDDGDNKEAGNDSKVAGKNSVGDVSESSSQECKEEVSSSKGVMKKLGCRKKRSIGEIYRGKKKDEECPRKRVKFVAKEEHQIHIVERIILSSSDEEEHFECDHDDEEENDEEEEMEKEAVPDGDEKLGRVRTVGEIEV